MSFQLCKRASRRAPPSKQHFYATQNSSLPLNFLAVVSAASSFKVRRATSMCPSHLSVHKSSRSNRGKAPRRCQMPMAIILPLKSAILKTFPVASLVSLGKQMPVPAASRTANWKASVCVCHTAFKSSRYNSLTKVHVCKAWRETVLQMAVFDKIREQNGFKYPDSMEDTPMSS